MSELQNETYHLEVAGFNEDGIQVLDFKTDKFLDKAEAERVGNFLKSDTTSVVEVTLITTKAKMQYEEDQEFL